MTNPKKIYTIGHSAREIDDFIKVLKSFGIENLVDIRTIPRSWHNPQFNKEIFKKELKMAGLNYFHLKELGGLRHPQKDSINTGWKNKSFRGYADYMQTEAFREGVEKLKEIGSRNVSAIMCAEALPWRCHRSLVADALTFAGWKVFDIFSPKKAEKHKKTKFMRIKKGQIYYPESD